MSICTDTGCCKRLKIGEESEESDNRRKKEEEMYVELSNKLMNEETWRIPDLYKYVNNCFEGERRPVGAEVIGKQWHRFENILKARD